MAKRVDRDDQQVDPIDNSPAKQGSGRVVADRDTGEVFVDNAVVDNRQAQLSVAGDDSIPREAVEAANKGRLARGEEPVVPDNVQVNQADLNLERVDPELAELDGVGEDTQAVKQSAGIRLADGRKRLQHNPDTGKIEPV